MKIDICEVSPPAEAVITVSATREQIDEILAALSFVGETVAGRKENGTVIVPLASVYYFETVDERLFFYAESETYECPARLKHIEERFAALPFARVSKTVIANLRLMRSIHPEKNGRLIATMANGEKLVVNRHYVREIKRKLEV